MKNSSQIGKCSTVSGLRSSVILVVFTLLYFGSSAQSQTLDDYLEIAAENNPRLKAKYANFEASLQRVAQSNSLPDPTISFGYFVSPIETRVGPQQAKISLTQMFPWFGSLKANEQRDTLIANARYNEFLDAKNELFYEVKAAWYPLYEINRTLVLQEENFVILQNFKQISTSKYKNGSSSMVDVIRVEILIENAETEIQILQDKKRPLLTSFNRLLNRVDSAQVLLPDSIFIEETANLYSKDSLVANNPLLDAYDLQIQSAAAQERLAQKKGAPMIGVGLDYMFIGQREGIELEGNGKNAFMPMVSMTLPIYRKKYNGAVKEAQYAQVSLAASKQSVENTLVSSFDQAMYDLNSSKKLVELYNKQTENTEMVISILLVSYSNSGKDFEEVLRMQQQLLKYQMAETIAVKNYYTALAKLDYLTGK